MMVSCSTDVLPPLGIYNQLEVDGAILPVHLHGNSTAKTALILVHGGPGESAILKREATGFYQLEDEHLMVYYDQRGSGISEGNVNKNTLTVEQMAMDLHAVIQLVETGSDVKNIFLISLDWGAATVVNYLTSTMKSPLVKGYVAVSPGFDVPLTMARSRDEILALAQELLFDGIATNDEAAQNIIAFYERHHDVDRYNYQRHYQLIEALGGIIINTDHEVSGATMPSYIQSLVDHNYRYLLENWSDDQGHFLESVNVADQLSSIDVPVKIIWGFWDRLIPVSLYDNYAPLLGQASDEELISIFPASANRPYLEEGDRFFATIATWLTFYD